MPKFRPPGHRQVVDRRSLRRIYDFYDQNESGAIEFNEMKAFFDRHPEVQGELWKDLDADQDGTLGFNEFCVFFCGLVQVMFEDFADLDSGDIISSKDVASLVNLMLQRRYPQDKAFKEGLFQAIEAHVVRSSGSSNVNLKAFQSFILSLLANNLDRPQELRLVELNTRVLVSLALNQNTDPVDQKVLESHRDHLSRYRGDPAALYSQLSHNYRQESATARMARLHSLIPPKTAQLIAERVLRGAMTRRQPTQPFANIMISPVCVAAALVLIRLMAPESSRTSREAKRVLEGVSIDKIVDSSSGLGGTDASLAITEETDVQFATGVWTSTHGESPQDVANLSNKLAYYLDASILSFGANEMKRFSTGVSGGSPSTPSSLGQTTTDRGGDAKHDRADGIDKKYADKSRSHRSETHSGKMMKGQSMGGADAETKDQQQNTHQKTHQTTHQGTKCTRARVLNEWVHTKTNGRIQTIVPQSACESASGGAQDGINRHMKRHRSVDPMIVFYFSARWLARAQCRVQGVFQCGEDLESPCPFTVFASHETRFLKSKAIVAVDVSYQNRKLRAIFAMSRTKRFDPPSLSSLLKGRPFPNLVRRLAQRTHSIALSLPAVSLDWTGDIGHELKSLGVKTAFGPRAQWFGISKSNHCSVLQKVVVDLSGHEALPSNTLPSTLPNTSTKDMKTRPVQTFQLKRPFTLIIYSAETRGAEKILIVGSVRRLPQYGVAVTRVVYGQTGSLESDVHFTTSSSETYDHDAQEDQDEGSDESGIVI